MDWNLLLVPIVGLGVWFVRSKVEEIKRATEDLRSQRREIYLEILEPFIQSLTGINDPSQSNRAKKRITSLDYKKVVFEMTMIGSDDVVGAMNDMMQSFYLSDGGAKPHPNEVITQWGGVLLAIRRDLGNRRTRLKNVDMLRFLIKDIDSLVR